MIDLSSFSFWEIKNISIVFTILNWLTTPKSNIILVIVNYILKILQLSYLIYLHLFTPDNYINI